jgi:hypothetical protein
LTAEGGPFLQDVRRGPDVQIKQMALYLEWWSEEAKPQQTLHQVHINNLHQG